MKKKVFLALMLCSVFTLLAGLSEGADPYVIAYQTDITGPGSSIYAPQQEGFRLYMQALNDKGGINGHPVNVLYEDDKSSPSRSGAVATKLILEDKVLAIIGLGFSSSHPPVYKLAKDNGVPVITGYSCVAEVWDPVKYDRKEIFATGSVYTAPYNTVVGLFQGLLPKLFPKGTKFALMGYTTAGGRMINSSVEKMVKEKLAFEIAYREEIPPETVDVSPWAQKVVAAKPNLLLPAFGAGLAIPFFSEMDKLGYTGALIGADALGTKDFNKAADSMINAKSDIYYPSFMELPIPFGDKPLPEYEEMKKAMTKYGSKIELSNLHAYGWVQAMIIEAALKKAGWPADRAGVLKALEQTNLDTRGLTPGPIIYTATDHRGPEYGKMYKWDYKERKMKTATDWTSWKAKELAQE